MPHIFSESREHGGTISNQVSIPSGKGFKRLHRAIDYGVSDRDLSRDASGKEQLGHWIDRALVPKKAYCLKIG